MTTPQSKVDGFRFLPPKLSAWIQTFIPSTDFQGSIPFQPLARPLNELRIATVTSAGISLKSDSPFDMQREKDEPAWGDPTCRMLPQDTRADDIQVNHLHINTSYIEEDINVILPLATMAELADEGVIGGTAPTAYSFYGFQWESTDFLETGIEPMIRQMKAEAVQAVLLTPA